MSRLSFRAAACLAAALLLTTAGCSTTGSAAGSDAPASPTTVTTTSTANNSGAHVDAAAFAAEIEQGATVLDVRTSEEFASGHLPGAINLDVNAPDFSQQLAELDPDKRYAVYCRSGNRSQTAIDLMREAGLTNTVGLAGGIGTWQGPLQ